MGCPVPKVCKTGAGAALLEDPDRAVALVKAARNGSGLPVTVKLRSGLKPGDIRGVDVAKRLVHDGGAAGLCLHPRHATQRHTGAPRYELVRELVDALPVPVLVSGGLHDADKARAAFDETGATAILLARGSLGNPWLFAELLGLRDATPPTREEILAELDWVIERACEHMGPDRASRYLRKCYPWYVERLGGTRALQAAVQRAATIDEVRELIRTQAAPIPAAA
jgi:tRNA-dihydrouridine synthase B